MILELAAEQLHSSPPAAPLQHFQAPAHPGAQLEPPTSLVTLLLIIHNCPPSSSALVCGTGVLSRVMKCPRPLSPFPSPPCRRSGPPVTARAIMALCSPSLCPAYNLVLYKARSSPCCARRCYSGGWAEGWGGGEGARGGWGSLELHRPPPSALQTRPEHPTFPMGWSSQLPAVPEVILPRGVGHRDFSHGEELGSFQVLAAPWRGPAGVTPAPQCGRVREGGSQLPQGRQWLFHGKGDEKSSLSCGV